MWPRDGINETTTPRQLSDRFAASSPEIMMQLAEQSGIPVSWPPLLHYPRCHQRCIVLLDSRQSNHISNAMSIAHDTSCWIDVWVIGQLVRHTR